MKLISSIFLFASISLITPVTAHALLISSPTVTIDGVSVTLGSGTSCGTNCTSYNIPTGTYGGLDVLNYSSTSLASIKVTDGTNSDTVAVTNIIFRNNGTELSGGEIPVTSFHILYQNTMLGLATNPQNYQVLLSGLFARPGSSAATGDQVTLTGNVSFSGGTYPTFIGSVSQTVGSNLVGSISPLKSGPTSISCSTTGCFDTLLGDLFLGLNVFDTFKMSGSSALGECDTLDLCTAQFNDEVQSWQTVQTPEPGSLLLVISGMGALGLGLFGKKRFFK
jgi:PEP-CTERM motif-containing protein